jgi:hypothetical protein
MKKAINNLLKVFAIFVFILFSYSAIVAAPPPPPPGATSNTQGNKLGGAPIGGGLFILLGLGAAYGGRKLWQSRQSDEIDLFKQKS